MKKLVMFILMVTMLVSLAGCSQPEPASVVEESESVNLSLGTASLGGNYFPMGAAIADIIFKEAGYKTTAQSTGGSVFNINAINNKELDLGLAQATAVADALGSKGKFEGISITEVRTVANYNATPQHILVNKKLNATNLSDLKGKKFEVITAGDGVEVATIKILSAIGISKDDVTLEYSGNRVQAASRLKTGQVDAIIDATGIGGAWMTDVIGNGEKFDLISLNDDQVAKISELNPEFSKITIPAGSYKGQSNDIVTIGNWTTVLASADLSEEIIYDIAKAFNENQEALAKAHQYFKDVDAKNIEGSVILPLHPGAEKYYKEVGVIN